MEHNDNYDVFAELATDINLEENGAWFPLTNKGLEGPCLLVARAGNKKFQRRMNKLVEANKAIFDMAEMSDKDADIADAKSEEILVDTLSETILLGWRKIAFKGEVKDYNSANAKLMLSVKDFRNRVSGFSQTFEAYKVKEEIQQGNG